MIQKENILKTCIQDLQKKLENLFQDVKRIDEGIASETKSSAGDKYETGREMMTQEKNKLQEQIALLTKQQSLLKSINPDSKMKTVEFGSLVETNNGIYFLAGAIGQVKLDQASIFVISMNSPIGQQLKGLHEGESTQWRNQELRVLSIR